MKLTRLLTGLVPALAAAVFIGLAAPAAIAQNNPPAAAPATEAAPAAAAPAGPAPAAPAPTPPRGPRRTAELLRHRPRKVHRQFRRHGVAFDLGRACPHDDH